MKYGFPPGLTRRLWNYGFCHNSNWKKNTVDTSRAEISGRFFKILTELSEIQGLADTLGAGFGSDCTTVVGN
jgi:hypothetical protein